jgi:hypothetical protein
LFKLPYSLKKKERERGRETKVKISNIHSPSNPPPPPPPKITFLSKAEKRCRDLSVTTETEHQVMPPALTRQWTTPGHVLRRCNALLRHVYPSSETEWERVGVNFEMEKIRKFIINPLKA